MYFVQFECRVSDHYVTEVRQLTQQVIKVLNQQQRIYWLDFGSLFALLNKV